MSDEESSSHSQTEKRIRRISDNIANSDGRSERGSKKKNKKISFFSRLSGLGSGKNIISKEREK